MHCAKGIQKLLVKTWRGRTTASFGVVRAERDWYRDEYGVFGLWEDAYGRAV
jgi:hypothetical protein